jgi:hypothetical protein
MDLSRLKWPIIIAIVVGAFWLITSPGINYMYTKFTASEIGVDPQRDVANEAGLTKLAGFLLKTFRYERAKIVLEAALAHNNPPGVNYYYNQYRYAKCLEKFGDFRGSADTLIALMEGDAHSIDQRVPGFEVLKLRIDKLLETHGLGEME